MKWLVWFLLAHVIAVIACAIIALIGYFTIGHERIYLFIGGFTIGICCSRCAWWIINKITDKHEQV